MLKRHGHFSVQREKFIQSKALPTANSQLNRLHSVSFAATLRPLSSLNSPLFNAS